MNFFPLSSCTKDIKSHLQQLKVAQTSVISEKDLILARVGLFDLGGNDMTVCPKHRAALGTWWRPILKCYHLLHGNKRRKPERGASLQMCKEPGGGYLGQFLLGMCRWPLQTPTPS